MKNFLIQEETLTNISNTIRNYITPPPMIDSSVTIPNSNWLVDDAIGVLYLEYIDTEPDYSVKEDYRNNDQFIAYDYLLNNDGVLVPVLYKTDVENFEPDEIDYGDIYFYIDTVEYEGILCDRWRKIEEEGNYNWESIGKIYMYTSPIVTNKIYPIDIPARINEIFNAGYNHGYEDGETDGYNKAYPEGIEAGKQAEYDAFWDSYQDNGNRTHYSYGFAGNGWTDELCKPKYDIQPTSAVKMFSATKIKDVKKIFEDAGVVLDLSKLDYISYFMDDYAQTERLPELNVSNVSSLQYFIYNCNLLKYIDKIILKADGSQAVGNYTLGNCPALEEVRFEGTIGKSGLNVQKSTKLSRESIASIINCLSTTTSELSVTLSKTAVDKAFETSKGANDGSTSTEWQNLIATRSNWTINYA